MLSFRPRSMDAPEAAQDRSMEPKPRADEAGGASGSNNQRKRVRELVEFAAGSAVNHLGHGFNVFSVGQPIHVIDLDQYHEHQQRQRPQYGVSTGLRLSPTDIEHRIHVQLPQHQHGSNSDGLISSWPSLNISTELADEIVQQGDALDRFLREQGEQLRQMVAIRRSSKTHSLLLVAAQRFGWKLSEKDKELEDARRHHEQLLMRNVQLATDLCAMTSRAQVFESEAAALRERIKNAPNGANGGGRREPGSGSGSGDHDVATAEDAGSVYLDPDRVVSFGFGPICKGCITRAASVVVLPCRHLCYCGDCGAAAIACPVCFCTKTSILEVYFS